MQTTLTVHCSGISFTQYVRKLRRNLLESSEIQSFCGPKLGGLPKKRSSPKLGLIFRWKFKRFLRPKTSGLLEKKKKNSPKLGLIFRPNPEIQTLERGLFFYGGIYFQFFTKNRPQKHQKRAILHTSQASGGLEPPLATLLRTVPNCNPGF